MRKLIILAIAAGCAALLPQFQLQSSTLQRLSLNDMILKSSMIVRGTIQPGSSAAFRGSLIYTHYQLSVAAAYKGTPGATVDVAIPGGVLNNLQQPVSGAPTLGAGQQYVIFLWTSNSGLTQVIGLSQGLFNLTTNAQGQAVVSRGAAVSPMLNSSGQPVADSNFQMPLAELTSTIQSVLAGGSGQ